MYYVECSGGGQRGCGERAGAGCSTRDLCCTLPSHGNEVGGVGGVRFKSLSEATAKNSLPGRVQCDFPWNQGVVSGCNPESLRLRQNLEP